MSRIAIFVFPPCCFVFGVYTPFLWILFLIVGFLSKFVGSLCPSSVFWNLNVFLQRLFLRSFFVGFLRLLLWQILFLTFGGWHEVKCVCKKLSVCLKCVFASRIDFSLNLVPLYTTVSKNTVSVSNVSAVNLIVGWCKFVCSMKASMSGLLTSQREKYRLCSISKLLV